MQPPLKPPDAPAALLSATICGIVTSSVTPPEPKNAATRSHHGTRDWRTPRAFRRRPYPFHAPRRQRAQRLARLAPHQSPAWRGAPIQQNGDAWQIELPLAETGFFKAKAYLLDPKGWQHWPDGPDVGISVHPNFGRTANAIYCAFTRLFGATKNLSSPRDKWH